MRDSEKFKERMVRRSLGPEGVSANALSKEMGVAQPTLSKWEAMFLAVALPRPHPAD
ncbi:MAG: hypothetical protein AAFU79_05510 [Myxococcota bacterium]